MKNVSPSLRRILGLVVAMVAGTLATFVLASPASAHYTEVHGVASCDYTTGTYTVKWTIFGKKTNLTGTLGQLAFSPSPSVMDIADGASVPPAPGALTGLQTKIPGTAKTATLQEVTTWPDHVTAAQSGLATMAGDCVIAAPKPQATFISACDGTVTGTLTNAKDATKDAVFTVTAHGVTKTYTVAAAGTQTFTTTAADSASITVMAPGLSTTYSWKQPPNCTPAKVSWKSDCTSLTVTLDNPAGNDPVDATVTSGTNPAVKVTVPGGGSKDVTFPATTGTTATVTFGAGAAAAARVAAIAAAKATEPVTVSWVSPGATCNPPTSPPNLPVTGAKLGGVIGAGALLIVVGAGLVLFLRRRRNIAPLQ